MRQKRASATMRGVAGSAAVGLLALAGCSSGTEGGTEEGTGEVTIRFTWWGSDERAAATQLVIEDFEEEHPGIKISAEPASFDGYFDSLATQIAAGDAPDVITLGGAYPQEYGARGALLDLSAVSGQLDVSPFDEAILMSSTVEGTVYGVPTGGNTVTVIANPEVFEEAGVPLPDDDTWTWEDFVEVANEVSANTPDGTYGVETRPYDLLGSYAAQRGGGLFDMEGELSVEAATLEEFWTTELELLEGGGMPSAETTNEIIMAGIEQTLMSRGQSAMIFAYSNQLGDYSRTAASDLVLLRLPGETQFAQQGQAILPSQYYGIFSGSDHPEEAATFVNFLVNSPIAGGRILVDRGIPANVEVRDGIKDLLDEYALAQVEYIDRVSEGAAPAIPQPPGASITNDLTVRIDSEVLFGRMTPAEAAAQWINEMGSSLATS